MGWNMCSCRCVCRSPRTGNRFRIDRRSRCRVGCEGRLARGSNAKFAAYPEAGGIYGLPWPIIERAVDLEQRKDVLCTFGGPNREHDMI